MLFSYLYRHAQRDPYQLYWYDRVLQYTLLPLIPRWILPNHITVFRMIATPVVLWLLLSQRYSLGIPVFVLVAFTDALDGALARTRRQITKWGSTFDPVADKLLIGSVVIIFVMQQLDFWLGVAILALETIFILTAWWRLHHGRAVQANIWGKIKMNLQVLGVVILLLAVVMQWSHFIPFSRITFYLAIVFALVSLVTYGI